MAAIAFMVLFHPQSKGICAGQQGLGLERLRTGIGAFERVEYDDAVFNLELSTIRFSEEDRENLWKAYFYLGLSHFCAGEMTHM